MTTSCVFDSLLFHEASVLSVAGMAAAFRVELELASESAVPALVVLDFHDVSSMSRDNVSVSTFRMERSDGEVLTLERAGEGFLMIVEWHDFNPSVRHTSAWRWAGCVTAQHLDRI